MKTAAERSGIVLYQHRFVLLLAALTFFLILTATVTLFGPGSILARVVVTAMFVVVLLSAVFADSQSRRTVLIALSLAVPTIILQALNLLLEQERIVIANHVLGISFLGYTVIVMLRHLFAGERITFDTICASLCIYLLLGVLWALVYSLIGILAPGSFSFTMADEGEIRLMRFGGEATVDAIYYSFVTISTLGYGDIVPISTAARMTAAMEAVSGQLYLAVLVARLVGLHIAQSTTGRNTGPGDA